MSGNRKITIRDTPSHWEVRLSGDPATLDVLQSTVPPALREWDWAERVWQVPDTRSIEQFIRAARERGFLVVIEPGESNGSRYLPPSITGAS